MSQRKLPNQDKILSMGEDPILKRYMKSADPEVVETFTRKTGPTQEEVNQQILQSYNSVMGIKEKASAGEELEQVVRIKLTDIIDHPKNPYRVHNHRKLDEMTESIRENGVLEPIIVSATYGDMDLGGKFICVAGHTRRYGSLRAGKEDIPGIIRKMTAEEIDIAVADSNIQREDVLPSEKAKAYRLKYDAMKRQGQRTDLTSVPGEQKLNTADIIAGEAGESGSTVRRYLRLSYLLPPLLDYVDNSVLSPEELRAGDKDENGNAVRVIPVKAGVAISYLTSEQQMHIFQEMAMNNVKQLPLDFAEELKSEAKGKPELGIDYFHAMFRTRFGKQPKAPKAPFSFFASAKAMREANKYFPPEYDTAEKRDEVVKAALNEYFQSRGIEMKEVEK